MQSENNLFRYLYTLSKNDVISSTRKHYTALGFADIRFLPKVFSSKCSRTIYIHKWLVPRYFCKAIL